MPLPQFSVHSAFPTTTPSIPRLCSVTLGARPNGGSCLRPFILPGFSPGFQSATSLTFLQSSPIVNRSFVESQVLRVSLHPIHPNNNLSDVFLACRGVFEPETSVSNPSLNVAPELRAVAQFSPALQRRSTSSVFRGRLPNFVPAISNLVPV